MRAEATAGSIDQDLSYASGPRGLVGEGQPRRRVRQTDTCTCAPQPANVSNHASLLLSFDSQTPPLCPSQPLYDGGTGAQTATRPGAAPRSGRLRAVVLARVGIPSV